MASTVTSRLGQAPGSGAKEPFKAVSQGAPITRSGLYTLGTVALEEGMRVLDKDATPSTDRGIYIATAGPWKRSPDWNRDDDVVSGVLLPGVEGTYQLVFAGDNVIGSTAYTFVRFDANAGSLVVQYGRIFADTAGAADLIQPLFPNGTVFEVAQDASRPVDAIDYLKPTLYIKTGGVLVYVGPAEKIRKDINDVTDTLFKALGAQAQARALVDKIRDVVDARDYGILGDGTTNVTTTLQALIDFHSDRAAPNNGVRLILPPGVIIAEGLTQRPRVFLEGVGVNATTLKLPNGSAMDLMIVPADAAFFGWRGFTLEGNRAGGATGRCLRIDDCNSGTITTPNFLGNKTVSGDAPYKFAFLSEFAAVNSGHPDEGIQIGQAVFGLYALFMDQFHSSRHVGVGITNHSTDNIFTNFYVENNGKSGIDNYGSNNKFLGFKSIFNGTDGNASNAGIRNSASRCDFISAEVQDNYCDGVAQYAGDDNNYDVLCDSNGYAVANQNASSRVAAHLRFVGGLRTKLRARLTNYRDGRLGDNFYPTEWPYVISGNTTFSSFDVSEAGKVANQLPLGDRRRVTRSSALVCTRNSTVNYGAFSFNGDDPALVPDAGLYVIPAESVEMVGTVGIGKAFSFVADFKILSTLPTTNRIVAASANNAFELDIKFSGGVVTNFLIAFMVGGVTYTLPLPINPSFFVDQAEFRVSGNFYIDDLAATPTLYRKAAFTSFDNNGKYYAVEFADAVVSGITASSQFGEIRGITLNPSLGITGQHLGFALWGSTVLDQANTLTTPGGGMWWLPNNGIFGDFRRYAVDKPINIRRGSVPVPSAFYRGRQIIINGNGSTTSDSAYICVQRADGAYSWQAMSAIDKTITLGTGDFQAVSGTPALTDVSGSTRRKCWAFDGISDEIISGFVAIEAGCTNLAFAIYWCNNGVGSGTVAWTIEYQEETTGTDLSALGISNDLAAAAAGAAGIAVITSGTIPLSGNARMLGIRIKRRAAAGTLTNDAGFVGISFRPSLPA